MLCRYCGSELDDSSAFCPYCRTSQVEVEKQKIPLFDRPLVTYAILGVCVLVYLVMQGISTIYNVDYNELLYNAGLVIPKVLNGEIWRFITSVFVHADIMHLAMNGYALWIYGASVEKYLGHGKFALLYALSGLMGGLFSLAFSSGYGVGASGAIYGLLGATIIILLCQNRLSKKSILINLIIYIAFSIVYSFNSSIGHFAHLGGLVGGILFVAILFKGNLGNRHIPQFVPILLLVLCLVIPTTIGITSETKQLDARYMKAVENLDYNEILDCTTKLFDRDPKDSGALYNKIVAEIELGKYDEADADFQILKELDPEAAKLFIEK